MFHQSPFLKCVSFSIIFTLENEQSRQITDGHVRLGGGRNLVSIGTLKHRNLGLFLSLNLHCAEVLKLLTSENVHWEKWDILIFLSDKDLWLLDQIKRWNLFRILLFINILSNWKFIHWDGTKKWNSGIGLIHVEQI